MNEPERKPDADKLAEEARLWDSCEKTLEGWEDAPQAVPRNSASQQISLRLPKKLLGILREFAAREHVGYQVLIKKWLDDRVAAERVALQRSIRVEQPRIVRIAASFDASQVTHVRSEMG